MINIWIYDHVIFVKSFMALFGKYWYIGFPQMLIVSCWIGQITRINVSINDGNCDLGTSSKSRENLFLYSPILRSKKGYALGE